MVDVFFRGYGAWWSKEMECYGIPNEQVTESYEACGVFSITDHDAMAYRYTKRLEGIKKLLSSIHPDSELVRALKLPEIKDLHAFLSFDSSVNEECYYFVIFTTETLLIAEKRIKILPQNLCITNKVRLCERSEPQSEPFVGQARPVQRWSKNTEK